MSLRVFLSMVFAYLMIIPSLQANTVNEKRNILILRASDALLRFSKNSETYRFGGGYQRRLSNKHSGNFTTRLGTYFEFQSNTYGDNNRDSILRSYVGLQFDYMRSESSLDGAFLGVYPALAVHKSKVGTHVKEDTTVGGILVETGKSIQLTSHLIYRPTIGYRKFAGRSGEMLIRPLEFSIEF